MTAFEQRPGYRRYARQPLRKSCTLVFVVRGRITRADLPGLTERLHRALSAGETDAVICDVGRLIHLDSETVDALARLQLIARRTGARVAVRHASPELR
ncbi:MAG: STAS domain-containing protein, partial [Actinomycetota bacterium]|nr:STAS domain-containing protein [Actinomycetota bacterium]